MKKRSLPVVYLFLLISFLVNIFFITRFLPGYFVKDVIDGDTFILQNGERIRLIGVNAPELGTCGSTESKTLLSSLVLNKPVRITEDSRDYYGRRMGLVYVGSMLVNPKIIESGWARPDYTKNSKNEEMKQAYKTAKEQNAGIHSTLCKQVNPIPPNSECTIKGNIDKASWDHFYHLPNCRHYNQIVLDEDIGEQFFCSEQEARDAGFILAPDCLR